MVDKEKAIKMEKSRLKKIFKDIDPNKLDFVNKLIDRLAWLNVTTKQLEEEIDREGITIHYDNGGGQHGTKDNPKVKTHTNFTKNISAISKMLFDLVPPSKKNSKIDEFIK